ncbi:MAG: hypothetical protein LBS43_06195 [Prevotellaceae bacterium]|jgi:hypothetical protein|nr:hypothetical protein [Prevotellaceae bacterium]
MIKKILKISGWFLGLMFLFSCDSGDIYPKEYEHNEGITAAATFVFDNPDAFPEDYPLIFGVFGDKQSIPLASVRIMKPKNNEPVKVSIDNISPDTKFLMLCMTDLGRLSKFTLFEKDINIELAGDSIVIPETNIKLVSYERIQNLVFEQYTCVSCHQGTIGAGNLLLTADKSYNALVNKVSSKNPAKNRVTPSDTGNSFLLEVLEDEDLGLTQPHTGFVTRNDDIVLLKEWIKNGCRR